MNARAGIPPRPLTNNNNKERMKMNYSHDDIEQVPEMLTLRADDYGLAFRCVAYPETGRCATFAIHVYGLNEDGEIGAGCDYMTRDVPENGIARLELIESANDYIREMLEEE